MSAELQISKPYPAPIVESVIVQKQPSEKLGVRVKSSGNAVYLAEANDNLHTLSQKVGHEILSINGHAVHSVSQVVNIISDYVSLEFTLLDPRIKLPPFCYVEVAPTSRINPGVSFDCCCNRTMVMVGEVFISDLTKTRIRKGDIVLAMNGRAVWKPEQADEEQLQAARNHKSLVLYCVNMEEMRDYCIKKAPKRQTINGNEEGRNTIATKRDVNTLIIEERDVVCTGKLDMKAQIYEDETEMCYKWKTPTASRSILKRQSYSFCAMTLEAVNKLMQEQLLALKEEIVSHAWMETIQKQDEIIPTYYVPSAPSTSFDIGTPDYSTPRYVIPSVEAIPIDTTLDL